MNLVEFDHSFVRQRNEELLRQAHTRHLDGVPPTRTGKGELLGRGGWAFGMRRAVLVVAATAVMAASAAYSASAAFASHEHYLLTPGTCVGDVASGQTSRGPGEGGYHKFHDHVHKGQPGVGAFENRHNPVVLDKETCPAG
jgi:hypothetical protein